MISFCVTFSNIRYGHFQSAASHREKLVQDSSKYTVYLGFHYIEFNSFTAWYGVYSSDECGNLNTTSWYLGDMYSKSLRDMYSKSHNNLLAVVRSLYAGKFTFSLLYVTVWFVRLAYLGRDMGLDSLMSLSCAVCVGRMFNARSPALRSRSILLNKLSISFFEKPLIANASWNSDRHKMVINEPSKQDNFCIYLILMNLVRHSIHLCGSHILITSIV